MIAAIHTRRLATKLHAFGVPVLNVSGTRREGTGFPRVTSDAEAVVRMAVTHLREKGLKPLAFCGEPQRPFIDFWTDTYRNVMREAGLEAVVYKPSARIGPRAGMEARQNDRRRWIESLPKPVGIIGWATGICRHLAMACTTSAIEVPEEVAIIGDSRRMTRAVDADGASLVAPDWNGHARSFTVESGFLSDSISSPPTASPAPSSTGSGF